MTEVRRACEKDVPVGMFRSRLCGKTAKAEREGHWYCGTHDPVAREARYQARLDAARPKWDARMALSRLNAAAPALLAACKLALEPGPDAVRGPRRLTIEAAIAKVEGAQS